MYELCRCTWGKAKLVRVGVWVRVQVRVRVRMEPHLAQDLNRGIERLDRANYLFVRRINHMHLRVTSLR